MLLQEFFSVSVGPVVANVACVSQGLDQPHLVLESVAECVLDLLQLVVVLVPLDVDELVGGAVGGLQFLELFEPSSDLALGVVEHVDAF